MIGKAYYRDAMKDHGLSGKIPTSFSTCGKPFLENIQYNSPIEMYDDKTVDEMVKVMDTAIVATTPAKSIFQTSGKPNGEIVTRMGWTVASSRPVNMVKQIEKTNSSDESNGI